jgi:hypothetical protein
MQKSRAKRKPRRCNPCHKILQLLNKEKAIRQHIFQAAGYGEGDRGGVRGNREADQPAGQGPA